MEEIFEPGELKSTASKVLMRPHSEMSENQPLLKISDEKDLIGTNDQNIHRTETMVSTSV